PTPQPIQRPKQRPKPSPLLDQNQKSFALTTTTCSSLPNPSRKTFLPSHRPKRSATCRLSTGSWKHSLNSTRTFTHNRLKLAPLVRKRWMTCSENIISSFEAKTNQDQFCVGLMQPSPRMSWTLSRTSASRNRRPFNQSHCQPSCLDAIALPLLK